jgi:lysophospholipase L1-like esterase
LEITAAELRCAWVVLACAFLTMPVPGSLRTWVLSLALLAPGAWLLARESRASAIALALTDALTVRPARVALILTAGLLAFTAWIFSVAGALVVVTVLATAVLAQAARVGPRAIQATLAGTVTLGALALTGGLVLEWLLGGAFATEVGAPSVRQAWEQRYADIKERNLFGFRSPYEQVVPEPGTIRVVALGDSYTWGDGIARTDDTWPAQLERMLRDTLRTPVEVINTGHSGWTTANEAELLRRFGWQWRPDLVVVQFTLNDVTESAPGFRDKEDPRLRILPQRFRSGAVGTSALLFLVETRLSVMMNPNWGSTNPARFHPDSLAWQQTAAAMREIADSARARSVPAVLLIYPLLVQGVWSPDTYPYMEQISQVARTGQEVGLDVINLVEVYGAHGGDWKRWWVSAYDPHPNAEANALAVRALMAHIGERGYLAPARRNTDAAPGREPHTTPAAR